MMKGLKIPIVAHRKYSVSPHITDKHMRFSPPPTIACGGYTLI